MKHGFDRLRQIDRPRALSPLTFQPNPAYTDYLKIHKVLVGPNTASELITIGESLDKDNLPQYLVAAGSAYCEAALTLTNESAITRMGILDKADASWKRALHTQMEYTESSPHVIDPADSFRTALDLARLPLLRGIIAGDVTQSTRDEVRKETLAIAGANNVRSKLAYLDQDYEVARSHVGLGHEANFLIAADSLDSPTFVAFSSFARSDTGHYYPNQTHDIILIQQKRGIVRDIMPVEIKAATNKKARNRYSALLIRGKIHLSYNTGTVEPENMRRAFVGLHLGVPTPQENRVTKEIRTNLLEMIHLYKSGAILGEVATGRSLLRFRDLAALHQKHPEIAGDLLIRK